MSINSHLNLLIVVLFLGYKNNNLFLIIHCLYYLQEQQKNELKKFNDQMKNVVDISEYIILKHDFETLTIKHRQILHLVLFKVFNNIKFMNNFMVRYTNVFEIK